MIDVIKINTIEELSTLLYAQEEDKKIGRFRSPCLFRGLPNESYSLTTSLERNCKAKQHELEKSILRNFTKYAAIEDSELKNSIWRQLIIGQHHGLPTRLLDWSYSPMMALHFATSGEDLANMENNNCVVWSIDINEINGLLPKRYRDKLNERSAYLFTVDMLGELTENLEKYDSEMADKAMVLLEPPSIDQRIINQYSYFSVIPSRMNDIELFLETYTANTKKYVIDKSIKWRVRDMLDQMNINERIAYPGLDGLTRWLKRHYYVK